MPVIPASERLVVSRMPAAASRSRIFKVQFSRRHTAAEGSAPQKVLYPLHAELAFADRRPRQLNDAVIKSM